jgi:hypothetical protein
VIYHVYNATTPCGECSGAMVSGHSYSADGVTWRSSNVQPYSQVAQKTDGTEWVLATRERPKVIQDPATRKLTHLVTGVCYGVSTCPPTPGVNCK